MSEAVGQLAIGEVAERAGMSASRIRYYEARGVLPEPERPAGKRRYTEDVFRRLAIIDAAQRVGFTLEEIRDLLGSRDQPAHERLRQLAMLKLPELDDLIARATSVRRVLKMCSRCRLRVDRRVPHVRRSSAAASAMHIEAPPLRARRGAPTSRRRRLTSTLVEVQQCAALLSSIRVRRLSEWRM